MNRREFLRRGVFAGGAILGAPMVSRGRFQLFAGSRTRYSARAIDLVERATVIDMLGLLTLDWKRLKRWQDAPGSFTGADWQKLRSSGITVFHPAVQLPDADPCEATRNWFAGMNALVETHPDRFARIDNAADLHGIKSSGKIGILLGMQNGCQFRTLDDVRMFYGLGQRLSQLTYNAENSIGCGCVAPRDTGLTDYGAAVVYEMNRIGMAVDVSHSSQRTALDAFEVSKKPVLITHTNCRSLVPGQPRCETDQVIRRMAAQGGVMGITSIRTFVSNREPTTIENVLDHFDHVARLVGVEHVGVGSDTDLDGRDRDRSRRRFDIKGLDHPQRIFDLTEGLIRRGYTDSDICLILGGNFQRVLGEIWGSASSQAAPVAG